MYKDNAKLVMPIAEAAAVDPRVKSLLSDISSGKVEPCAPCSEMYLPWTPDEKRRLDRALSLVIKPR